MKLKYFYLIFLCIIFGLLLNLIFICKNYNGNFHFENHVISFHLNELIQTEESTSITITRFFHNKISVFIFDLFSRYLQFFNIFYLINILSIFGVFGLFYFYFSIFKEEKINKFFKFFSIILLLIPFLEIFQFNKHVFVIKIIMLIIPYQIASFLGILFFIRKGDFIKILICSLLILLSIGWFIVFNKEILSFCTI